MNLNPPLGPWATPLGWLALEASVVVLAALAWQPFLRAATTRRALWRAVLVVQLGLLVAELTGTSSQLPAQLRRAWQTTFPPPAPPAPPEGVLPSTVPPPSFPISYSPSPIPSVDFTALATEPPTPLPPAPLPTLPPAPPVWPALLWLTGLAVLLARSAWTHAGFAWLRFRHFHPAAEALRERVAVLAARLGLRRRVRVLASERLRAPAAFGWLRPGVAVPGDFTARFAPAQQDVMLAHELAHLAARDPLWQLLADLAAAALWWHPLVWVARRQHRLAGELAADDASLALPDGPVVLAECLLTLGHEAAATPPAALGMAGFRSQLGRRVERLLALPRGDWQPAGKLRSCAQTAAALTLLAALALLPGCAANRTATEAPASVVAKWWQAKTKPPEHPARAVTLPKQPPAKPVFIAGTVRYNRTPPPERDIPLPPTVLAARTNAPMKTRFHRVAPDGGLADALVYVKAGLTNQHFAPPTNTHLIRIQRYEYQPYITAVQTGQPIRWESDVMLNFHPMPTNAANREFNRALMPDRPVEATFTAPELFLRTKDDVHPWLFGYVSVLPHPFFAVTDAEGRFRFPQPLPPGNYTLAVLHRSAGIATRELVVDAQSEPTPPLEFVLGPVMGREAIRQKLADTHIPNFLCDGMPMAHAVQLLGTMSRTHDPSRQGVSFGWRNTYWAAVPGDTKPGTTNAAPSWRLTTNDISSVLINIPSVPGISLLEGLDLFVKTADQPIGFTIETNRVMLHPREPGRPFVSPRGNTNAPGARLRAQAEKLVLPQVQYDGLPLTEVIKLLDAGVRQHAPDQRGVTFLATSYFPDAPAGWQPRPPRIGGLPPKSELRQSPDLDTVIIRLGELRRNLTLPQTLDAICAAADHAITYRFEDWGILFTPDYSRKAGPKPPAPKAASYTVGVGDKLRVQVYRRDDLGYEAKVRPGGDIFLPFIRSVPVAGKTIAAVRDDLRAAFKGLRQVSWNQNWPEFIFAHLEDPAVTVTLVQSAPQPQPANPVKARERADQLEAQLITLRANPAATGQDFMGLVELIERAVVEWRESPETARFGKLLGQAKLEDVQARLKQVADIERKLEGPDLPPYRQLALYDSAIRAIEAGRSGAINRPAGTDWNERARERSEWESKLQELTARQPPSPALTERIQHSDALRLKMDESLQRLIETNRSRLNTLKRNLVKQRESLENPGAAAPSAPPAAPGGKANPPPAPAVPEAEASRVHLEFIEAAQAVRLAQQQELRDMLQKALTERIGSAPANVPLLQPMNPPKPRAAAEALPTNSTALLYPTNPPKPVGADVRRLASPQTPDAIPQTPSASKQLVTSSPTKGLPVLIQGRVLLQGAPTAEHNIPLPPTALAARTNAPLKTRFHRVSPDGGLADVVVYVKAGLPKQEYHPPSEALVVHAQRYEFQPYIGAVQVGQPVIWDSVGSDTIGLQVTPTNWPNRGFRRVLSEAHYEQASFPAPELFIRGEVYVHPWMLHYISVFEHPYFAVSDAEGRFRFPQPLPPGKYTLAAVHRLAGESTQEINVHQPLPASQPLDVQFTFTAAQGGLTTLPSAVPTPLVVTPTAPPTREELLERKARVEAEIKEAEKLYRPSHPKMIGLRKQLETVEEALKEDAKPSGELELRRTQLLQLQRVETSLQNTNLSVSERLARYSALSDSLTESKSVRLTSSWEGLEGQKLALERTLKQRPQADLQKDPLYTQMKDLELKLEDELKKAAVRFELLKQNLIKRKEHLSNLAGEAGSEPPAAPKPGASLQPAPAPVGADVRRLTSPTQTQITLGSKNPAIVLAAGDSVRIQISHKHNGTNQSLAFRGEIARAGYVPIPRASKAVFVAGRTIEEATRMIREQLVRDGLESPQVTLDKAVPLQFAPPGTFFRQRADTYRIQPGDELIVSIWGRSDLRTKGNVQADGRLTLPLVEAVPIAGHTITDARAAIKAAYQPTHLAEAHVAVQLFRTVQPPPNGTAALSYPTLPDLVVLHPPTLERLAKMRLPEVSFNALSLPTVLQHLAADALRLEPDRDGLKFEVQKGLFTATAFDPPAASEPEKYTNASGAVVSVRMNGSPMRSRVRLNFDMGSVTVGLPSALRDVHAVDALEAIVKGADFPVRYTIETNRVIFWQRHSDEPSPSPKPSAPKPGASLQPAPVPAGADVRRLTSPAEVSNQQSGVSQRLVTSSPTAVQLAAASPGVIALPVPNPYARTNSEVPFLTHSSKGAQGLNRKLDRIVLPEVHFDGVPLAEVVKRLAEDAQKFDPEPDPKRKGVNLLINDVAPAAPLLDVSGNPVPAARPVLLSEGLIRVNQPLKNLTLRQALDVICKTAELPTQFSVEEYAIAFIPRGPGGAYFSRTFRVNPDTFMQGLQGVASTPVIGVTTGGNAAGAAGQNQPTTTGPVRATIPATVPAAQRTAADANALVRQFFLSAGVTSLGATNSATQVQFNPQTGALTVRGTPNELRVIEQAIQKVPAPPAVPADKPPAPNPAAPLLSPSSKGAQRINRKLDEIILPEIHFDSVSLPAVVTWLDGSVKKHDPEKKGLNFMINNVVTATFRRMTARQPRQQGPTSTMR
ncbi:MAG: hypothetical protein RL514_2105 [Verrucomicrobiota bacterium]|jgi:protein involved in polysaccharide export with SLBB domain